MFLRVAWRLVLRRHPLLSMLRLLLLVLLLRLLSLPPWGNRRSHRSPALLLLHVLRATRPDELLHRHALHALRALRLLVLQRQVREPGVAQGVAGADAALGVNREQLAQQVQRERVAAKAGHDLRVRPRVSRLLTVHGCRHSHTTHQPQLSRTQRQRVTPKRGTIWGGGA